MCIFRVCLHGRVCQLFALSVDVRCGYLLPLPKLSLTRFSGVCRSLQKPSDPASGAAVDGGATPPGVACLSWSSARTDVSVFVFGSVANAKKHPPTSGPFTATSGSGSNSPAGFAGSSGGSKGLRPLAARRASLPNAVPSDTLYFEYAFSPELRLQLWRLMHALFAKVVLARLGLCMAPQHTPDRYDHKAVRLYLRDEGASCSW